MKPRTVSTTWENLSRSGGASLSLGACLGGNGTLVGASANVVIAGFSEKTKTPLNFKNYFRYGFPLMLISVAISAVYILVRYLLFR